MRSPANLGELLDKELGAMGIKARAKRYGVFSLWEEIVGDLSKHARPRKVDGDVLYVTTSSSVWAQELSYMSRKLLRKINGKLGDSLIKEIRFSTHMWNNLGNRKERSGRQVATPQSFSRKNNVKRSLDQVAADLQRAMQSRKEYLLQTDHVLCSSCGYIYPIRFGTCPFCRLRTQSKAYVSVLAILERKPETPDSSILEQVGIDDREIVYRARQELDERWMRMVRYRLNREKYKSLEVKEMLRKLACLRCCKDFKDITGEQLSRVLGKRLYGYLKWRAKGEKVDSYQG